MIIKNSSIRLDIKAECLKIFTENDVEKMKPSNPEGEPKWEKILNRKDLEKLE